MTDQAPPTTWSQLSSGARATQDAVASGFRQTGTVWSQLSSGARATQAAMASGLRVTGQRAGEFWNGAKTYTQNIPSRLAAWRQGEGQATTEGGQTAREGGEAVVEGGRVEQQVPTGSRFGWLNPFTWGRGAKQPAPTSLAPEEAEILAQAQREAGQGEASTNGSPSRFRAAWNTIKSPFQSLSERLSALRQKSNISPDRPGAEASVSIDATVNQGGKLRNWLSFFRSRKNPPAATQEQADPNLTTNLERSGEQEAPPARTGPQVEPPQNDDSPIRTGPQWQPSRGNAPPLRTDSNQESPLWWHDDDPPIRAAQQGESSGRTGPDGQNDAQLRGPPPGAWKVPLK